MKDIASGQVLYEQAVSDGCAGRHSSGRVPTSKRVPKLPRILSALLQNRTLHRSTGQFQVLFSPPHIFTDRGKAHKRMSQRLAIRPPLARITPAPSVVHPFHGE